MFTLLPSFHLLEPAEVVSISLFIYYHFVFQSDGDMTVHLLRFISICFETGSNIQIVI